jgi:hypothetical protein
MHEIGQKEESFPHILHPGHTLARQRMEIFGSALLQMTDIKRDFNRMVLA